MIITLVLEPKTSFLLLFKMHNLFLICRVIKSPPHNPPTHSVTAPQKLQKLYVTLSLPVTSGVIRSCSSKMHMADKRSANANFRSERRSYFLLSFSLINSLPLSRTT